MTIQHTSHQQALSKKKRPKKKQPKKKRLDLRQWYYELQSLDSQNYGSWPVVIKGVLLVIAMLLTALICYLLLIRSQLGQIEVEENRQQILTQTYQASQAKANQLTAELDEGEGRQQHSESLSRLIPSVEKVTLPQQFNELGISSGVAIKDLQLAAEQEQDFYIEQPLKFIASGNYHQIGEFLGSLSALPRLITLHDFSVKAVVPESVQQAKSPDLVLTLHTKAYRLKLPASSETDSDEIQGLDAVSISNVPEGTEIVGTETKATEIKSTETKDIETNAAEAKTGPYQPKDQRSPFSLPNFVSPQSNPDTKPDISSVPAPPITPPPNKQQHPLSNFQYRGMMTGIGRTTYGLIQRPDGIIMRVQIGQTVGHESIKVIEITPTQINLVQQLEDPEIGYSKNRLALIAPISPSRNTL